MGWGSGKISEYKPIILLFIRISSIKLFLFIYRYSKYYESKKAVTWRCTSRPAGGVACKALVKQTINSADFLTNFSQGDFILAEHAPGLETHCHKPVVGIENVVQIYKACKDIAAAEKFKPATEIAMEVMMRSKDQPGTALAKTDDLRRAINNGRSPKRPPKPRQDDPNFPVNTEYFAGDCTKVKCLAKATERKLAI